MLITTISQHMAVGHNNKATGNVWALAKTFRLTKITPEKRKNTDAYHTLMDSHHC
jgi:hypothetical protein